MDTGDSYGLDLLISDKKHAKNFSSCNFIDVLANFFGYLSSGSMDFHFSLAFPVSSTHLVTSNDTSVCKLLNSISPNGPIICNLGNIFIIYHRLFAYLTIKPSPNIVSTDSSHLSSDSIDVE